MNRIFIILENNDPRVILTQLGAIYLTIIVKKSIGIYLRSQVSVYRTIGPLG